MCWISMTSMSNARFCLSCNFRAARFGVLKMASELVGRKASVCATDRSGNTPLHLACEAGHMEVAKVRKIVFPMNFKIEELVLFFFQSDSCFLSMVLRSNLQTTSFRQRPTVQPWPDVVTSSWSLLKKGLLLLKEVYLKTHLEQHTKLGSFLCN